ncbi:MAG: IS256 family transposase [Ilumatobacter sp.]|uniref:IS256 family transposase n=1 Tax=Ilumatobacter sp. TaxID=1967498 RepID=UPI00260BCD64|nr:IS256 family transposase [Ilumatobacter sp.]MDJ0769262.1 IS256 family transposase [Ilumatobacter sp.]
MTHHDDARFDDLVAQLGDGDSKDLFRLLLERGMQDLIDAELTATIGAELHERTDTRTNHRNGARQRTLSTPAGDIELRIPKLRVGSFFPSLLEPRRRVDQALWAVIMTAYITGTSTRKVDDLVRALGCESGVSKSTVSRICKGIDDEVAVFRTRPLDHIAMPYVYLDATYIKARNNHRIVSRAVVVATAVTADGNREVLGLDVGDSEDEVFWTAFLRTLRDRGLDGVRLVISDAHAGLKAAVARVFAGASWQRCKVHLARNVLATVNAAHKDMVAATVRTIYAQPDPAAIRTHLHDVVTMLEPRFPIAAEILASAEGDVTAFAAFPRAHWRKIASTNPLVRINKELKRRSNVVGIFPDDASVVRLVGAVLLEQHDEWAVAERRYLSEESMALIDADPEEVTTTENPELPAA